MLGAYPESMVYGYGAQTYINPLREDDPQFPFGGCPIPPEYLPTYQVPDPWHMQASSHNDFILIAEFSEQEGPKPLITIPTNITEKLYSKFDLNQFTVKIMSVDFHLPIIETFALNADSEVVISESSYGLYAYVHYFTLYDHEARGFVRPLCLAYVTPDYQKLMSCLENMTKEFSKVTEYFKYGNIMLFVKDMTHYVTDLQYTKERFLERNDSDKKDNYQKEEEAVFKTMTTEVVDNCIREVKSILDVASKKLSNRDLEERFTRLEERCKEKNDIASDEESSSYSASYSNQLLLEPPSTHSSSRENKSGSTSSLNLENFSSTIEMETYRPKLVRTVNRRRFDRQLRTIHELCHWGAKEGLNRLRSIQKYFSRDNIILEIEKSDSLQTYPGTTLLTFGQSVTANFTSQRNSFDFTSSRTSVEEPLVIRKWLSDDTLNQIQTSLSSPSYPMELKEPIFILGGSYMDRYITNPTAGEGPISINNTDEEIDTSKITKENNQSEICSSQAQESASIKHFPVFSFAEQMPSLTSNRQCKTALLKLLNQFTFAPHLMFSLMIGRPLIVTGNCMIQREVEEIVSSFSILVPGHSRCHKVIPWQNQPLEVTDRDQVKLIGLCRPEGICVESMIPRAIRDSVSHFDLEKGTLTAPQYKGSILNTIYSKRKYFKTELAFITFLQSVLLQLVQKAFVLYHATLDKISLPLDTPGCGLSSANDGIENTTFSKLHVTEDDKLILMYFTSIVRYQIFGEKLLAETSNAELPPQALNYIERTPTVFKA